MNQRRLSVQETAKALRISRTTLWRWHKAGLIRMYRVGPWRLFCDTAEVKRVLSEKS